MILFVLPRAQFDCFVISTTPFSTDGATYDRNFLFLCALFSRQDGIFCHGILISYLVLRSYVGLASRLYSLFFVA